MGDANAAGAEPKFGEPVVIDYTNWKGKRSIRIITPVRFIYGISSFHEGRQYFLKAWDHEKQAMRDFALKDIHSWSAPTTHV